MTQFSENNERRSNYPRPETDMYKGNVDTYIKTERRKDELDRLQDVREQKKAWNRTVLFCLLLNLTFLTLGIIGLYIG